MHQSYAQRAQVAAGAANQFMNEDTGFEDNIPPCGTGISDPGRQRRGGSMCSCGDPSCSTGPTGSCDTSCGSCSTSPGSMSCSTSCSTSRSCSTPSAPCGTPCRSEFPQLRNVMACAPGTDPYTM